MTDDNNNQDSQGEKVYYDEGNVKITSRRTILDDKTYVLKNISSVTVNTIHHEAVHHDAIKVGAPWAYMLGGFLIILSILGLSEGNAGALIFLGIGSALCYYAYSKSKDTIAAWETPAWDEYSVRIGSNAGETDGLRSKDKDYITKIVNAINDAIIEN